MSSTSNIGGCSSRSNRRSSSCHSPCHLSINNRIKNGIKISFGNFATECNSKSEVAISKKGLLITRHLNSWVNTANSWLTTATQGSPLRTVARPVRTEPTQRLNLRVSHSWITTAHSLIITTPINSQPGKGGTYPKPKPED